MHTSIKELKTIQKSFALEIKELKNKIKSTQKERGSGAAGREQADVIVQKSDYRHRHIAYCLLRGRKYEEIENRCREGNEPNWTIIQEIKDEYAAKDVCAGAA